MASTTNPLGPLFTAGGLASGLDTNSIVDQLTQIASQPITALQREQSAIRTQISSLGDMAARIASLKDAADALGKNGALGVSVTSSNVAFAATASPAAAVGSFQIAVTDLAVAAQARSQAFASSSAPVTGGTLNLNVQGTAYSITMTDGEALSDVAFDINRSGAPVSATVLNTGTNAYLSITNRATGFPIGGTADQALSITETSTGSQGQPLAATIITPAANATFTVDQLPFTRTSNTFSDAIPGTTITLKAKSASAETLTLDTDTTATQQNLQKFVDAYNHAMQLVQTQLAITGTTDTTTTLAHDPAVRALQGELGRLIMTSVGTGPITSLADLGIETERDGSLTLDSSKLANAISQNPTAVNAIFQDASAGITKAIDDLAQRYTDSVSGILTLDSQGLSDNVSRMDDQLASLQLRVDAYHDTLIAQFTAMETLVSKMKSIGNFLSARDAKS